MQTIPLQAIPKQSLTIVLENVLYDIALKETAGCMSVDIDRAGERIVSGARCVAGQLLLNYEALEDGFGNFLFLTEGEDLPYWDQFGNTQTLMYASAEDLAAVRNGN